MARTVTLLQVRDRVRERCDMVGSLFITDAEFNKLIDAAYTELVDILIKNQIHQFETTQTITTITGTTSYALPSDYYKTLGVEWMYSSTQALDIPELTFAERNKYANDLAIGLLGARAAGYRLVGANIVFPPGVPGGQTYRHIYVPTASTLVGAPDATIIDGIDGWDEFLVILSAIKAKTKEESDTTELRRDEAIFRQRIAEMSVDRGQVQEVSETHSYGERLRDDDWYYRS